MLLSKEKHLPNNPCEGATYIESRGKLRKFLFYERGKLSIVLMKKFRV